MSRLTHLDADGRAKMVDVGDKPVTRRVAEAEAVVSMAKETLRLLTDNEIKKGDVLAVARIAGIQAAKRCDELIPLCHSLPLDSVRVDFEVNEARSQVRVIASASLSGRTGVEMEALTAATVAALTIYDMCKAVDRGMQIDSTRLLRKEGGRSGTWINEEARAVS